MTPEQIADFRQTRYNARVAWLRKTHPDLMMIRIQPDYPLPAHKPGQYCSLGLGYWEPRHPGCQEEPLKPGAEARVVRRAYSIGSSVLDDRGELFDRERTDWLEFYIVLVRESDKAQPPGLTPRLFMLREGDRLIL